MLTLEESGVEAEGQSSEDIAPDSNRGATETARLQFEGLKNEVNSEAPKTAYIHLIVSRGFWNRKPGKLGTESKPKS